MKGNVQNAIRLASLLSYIPVIAPYLYKYVCREDQYWDRKMRRTHAFSWPSRQIVLSFRQNHDFTRRDLHHLIAISITVYISVCRLFRRKVTE